MTTLRPASRAGSNTAAWTPWRPRCWNAPGCHSKLALQIFFVPQSSCRLVQGPAIALDANEEDRHSEKQDLPELRQRFADTVSLEYNASHDFEVMREREE